MPLILVHSPAFADHQPPPGHPERPERADVMEVVADEWRARGGEVVAPRLATREHLARVHDDEHLTRVAETAGRALALDPDTFTSPDTYEVARLAAGAAVDGVERTMGGYAHVLALVRPPGHHAERHRAMGFCFYNNAAVAAAHARQMGAARVAIVDYDVHHGNGTQQIFEADPAVLYISVHQFPFYPGTGDAVEIGMGDGRGFTVNVPVEVGAVDTDYRVIFADVVIPVLRAFAPDVLIVSAGFDAHERDPLGGARLTTEAFAAMTADLRRVAADCCQGRLLLVTEGGYDLHALADCLHRVVDVLAPDEVPHVSWPDSHVSSSRGRSAVIQARRALAAFWPCLGATTAD
jgi:acetoin utilization deacetylase AcuC-like enzyme